MYFEITVYKNLTLCAKEYYLLIPLCFCILRPYSWVILSKIIAKATIAKPLNNPRAKYWFDIALKIGTPKPLTPIIDAMTTIAKAIIIVWLTPAKTVGRA